MIIIDILFYLTVSYVALVFLVMLTSKGGCFFCGKRLSNDEKTVKIKNRKWCGCDIKGSDND